MREIARQIVFILVASTGAVLVVQIVSDIADTIAEGRREKKAQRHPSTGGRHD
mgnify:CR=1 FL=1